MPDDLLSSILLTLALAGTSTLLLVLLATPMSWWLARSRRRVREFVAAFVSLPIVLPPTVLGFYLLIALGPNGPGGALAGLWGGRTLAFSFAGLVIGSLVYSLPFMVQPLRNAFEAIGDEPLEAAACLGASDWARFWRVAVPLAMPGYLAGALLSFAHTLGEFGVVLMIGGNIPGETRVLSIAIYDLVERLQWREAHAVAFALALFGFLVVSATMLIGGRFSPART